MPWLIQPPWMEQNQRTRSQNYLRASSPKHLYPRGQESAQVNLRPVTHSADALPVGQTKRHIPIARPIERGLPVRAGLWEMLAWLLPNEIATAAPTRIGGSLNRVAPVFAAGRQLRPSRSNRRASPRGAKEPRQSSPNPASHPQPPRILSSSSHPNRACPLLAPRPLLPGLAPETLPYRDPGLAMCRVLEGRL